MKINLPLTLTLGMLFLLLTWSPVIAEDTRSFRTSLLKVDLILQALDDFTEDSPLLPGDTMTYGKLIKSGLLSEGFCKESIKQKVCGGPPVVKEYEQTIGPPLETFENFGVVRIILPYRNPRPRDLARINVSIRGYPALSALLRTEKGTIPLVLYEAREGALKRLLSAILNQSPTNRSPVRKYHL